jgi:hypothetical protein
MRKNTCRKDIRHPRPVCAPSLTVIGSIPGEDGAHTETGKKQGLQTTYCLQPAHITV